MEQFERIKRLPPYVFQVVNELKMRLRRAGEDIIDLGMGNPDIPTPKHIVSKVMEAIQNPRNHRYSASMGIPKLREAFASWWKRRYDVDLDPVTEVVATMGAKDALAHLVLATITPGDVVFVPSPTYPIHPYSVVIAGGDLRHIPIRPDHDFFEDLKAAARLTWPLPKMLIISFPHNPTTMVVDQDFFKRIVEFAMEYKIMVIHDFAYADLTFDGYKAPSFLAVPGAKEVGVEVFSMSKSYSMAGWRVGCAAGNPQMIEALRRLKSYIDYGIFQPVQIGSIIALNEDQSCVREIVDEYKERRDVLCSGLNDCGWSLTPPLGTMFAWARIPEQFRGMGSLEFSKLMTEQARVAVSPGIGFGPFGDEYVRFALVENRMRIQQAVRGIRHFMQQNGQSCAEPPLAQSAAV
ncbi:aminotransferase class I/II-fold pyridoxal phosphate-dependent enzyme [Desulfomonile tiedjei]|uniref:Aminotransferase n=1 Tax=Desulfomonile tiedjei (strain ATCC 49306 / DSM 6799 / DCB-1) TaxID=706587 RepID=I4C4B2_DESTA|nr:aminotransferase class I/II-fold pyridoxal phosphate-dependent enzyme [Desulfomonile tiedjei]AFM24403.1 aspartate/tyrosine/aromatic aminotransferase [Desulfomonile tiedjei DSM 6799]